jgi:hypothetical protein
MFLALLLLQAALLGTLAGCGNSSSSSGSGIVATGKGAVDGNVVSSNLPGGIGGIVISAGSRTTRTDSKGRFNLRDVPIGSQVVHFRSDGKTASLPVEVPDSATVSLKNVRIRGVVAAADSVSVTSHHDGDAGDGDSPDDSGMDDGDDGPHGNDDDEEDEEEDDDGDDEDEEEEEDEEDDEDEDDDEE